MSALLEELTKLSDKGIGDAELKEHKKAYQAKFDNDLSSDETVSTLLDDSLDAGRTLAFAAAVTAATGAPGGGPALRLHCFGDSPWITFAPAMAAASDAFCSWRRSTRARAPSKSSASIMMMAMKAKAKMIRTCPRSAGSAADVRRNISGSPTWLRRRKG